MAHSHGLKAIVSKPDAPKNARAEQRSWLRRALKHSTSLYEVAGTLAQSGSIDQRTLAEITIYHLALRSELYFERSAWAEALTDLAARRKLLSTLAEAARDSYDQALATEFIDAYDPLIRFAAYKLGRQESHDIEGVVKDIDGEMMEDALPGYGKLVEALRGETNVEEMEKGRKELEDVTFGGDNVELRSAEIVGVMLKVQEALVKVQGRADGGKGKGMRGWDKVLAVLGEAEGIARRLVEDHEVSSVLRSYSYIELIESRPGPARCARPRRHNPSRLHINISSISFCRTGSSEISCSLKHYKLAQRPFPPIQPSSRCQAERSSWKKRSRTSQRSSSYTILSSRACLSYAILLLWKRRME